MSWACAQLIAVAGGASEEALGARSLTAPHPAVANVLNPERTQLPFLAHQRGQRFDRS
jgi:hypothetical protein